LLIFPAVTSNSFITGIRDKLHSIHNLSKNLDFVWVGEPGPSHFNNLSAADQEQNLAMIS